MTDLVEICNRCPQTAKFVVKFPKLVQTQNDAMAYNYVPLCTAHANRCTGFAEKIRLSAGELA
jgi:hypothetical protein